VGHLTEVYSKQSELALHSAGTAAQLAPRISPRGKLRLPLCFGDLRFTCHALLPSSLGRRPFVWSNYAAGDFGVAFSSTRNGIPKARSSSRASSLLSAEVMKAMFMPCVRVNLSGLISGNTSCSVRPML